MHINPTQTIMLLLVIKTNTCLLHIVIVQLDNEAYIHDKHIVDFKKICHKKPCYHKAVTIDC